MEQDLTASQLRRPIQLKPIVKNRFDNLHQELGKKTQSETVAYLLEFYSARAKRVTV